MSSSSSSSSNVTTSSLSNNDLPAQSNRMDRYLVAIASLCDAVDADVSDGRPLLSDVDPPALERPNLDEKTQDAPRFTVPDDWHGPVIAIDQPCCMDYRCRNTLITPGMNGANESFCRKHSGTGLNRGFTSKAAHQFIYKHQGGGKHSIRKPTMMKKRKVRISELDLDVTFTGVSDASISVASPSLSLVGPVSFETSMMYHSAHFDSTDPKWHANNIESDKFEHCFVALCEHRAVHYGFYVGRWRYACVEHRVCCDCMNQTDLGRNIAVSIIRGNE